MTTDVRIPSTDTHSTDTHSTDTHSTDTHSTDAPPRMSASRSSARCSRRPSFDSHLSVLVLRPDDYCLASCRGLWGWGFSPVFDLVGAAVSMSYDHSLRLIAYAMCSWGALWAIGVFRSIHTRRLFNLGRL